MDDDRTEQNDAAGQQHGDGDNVGGDKIVQQPPQGQQQGDQQGQGDKQPGSKAGRVDVEK